MKLAPRLFLGLGEMGHTTVEEIARNARHLYSRLDQAKVAYLSLMTQKPASTHTPIWVQQAQVSALLKHAEAQPEWQHWLDTVHYRDTARQDASQERQLARGLFVYSLVCDGGPYPLLQAQARQISAEASPQGTTLAYLFGSLDEMVTRACLLDIANLVQRAFRSVSDASNMRLIMYLALPAPNASDLTQAQAFAALRELERYATPSGQADTPALYSTASGLESFNAYTNRMIDMLRAYPYQESLPSLWSDVALTQLDPETFSTNFVQTEIVNYTAREMLPRQSLEDPYALVSGAYFVQVFSLPLIEIRQHCQRVLIEESIGRSIGTPWPPKQQQAFLSAWLNHTLSHPQGQRLTVPRLLRWLYEPFDKPSLSLDEALSLLYTSDAANDAVLADARRLRALELEWWPQTHSQPNQGLGHHLLSLMRDHLGTDFDPSAKDEGRYALALAAMAHIQTTRLNQARDELVSHLLATHGLRPLVALLKDTLKPRLLERLHSLKQWVALQESRIKDAHWLRDLEISASTLGSTRNLLGQTTRDAQVFVNRCQHATEAFKLLHAARQLERLCQVWYAHLQALDAALQPWEELWRTDSFSLPPKPSPAAPHRLMLVDTAWQDRMASIILDTHKKAFCERLAWRWQPNATSGALSLTWDGQALPNQVDLLRQHFEQASLQALRDATLGLWDDLLSSPDLRSKALQHMRTHLDQAQTWEGQAHAQIVIHHLLLGDWRGQEDYRAFAQSLLQMIEAHDNRGLHDHGPLYDSSRLVYLRIEEALPLHSLPQVQRLRSSYKRQFNEARPRLHVLAPEIQAARLEGRLRQQGQQVMFNSQIVSLLHHANKIRLFVYAEALDIIQAYAMIRERERYALILDEQQVWDMGEGGRRLYAIMQFCLAEPPIRLQQALRQQWPQGDALHQAISQAISRESTRRADDLDGLQGPHADTVRLLQTSSLQASDARRIGQEAQALWDYLHARQAEATQEHNRVQRELALLLAQVARDLYDEKNRWLNNRLL